MFAKGRPYIIINQISSLVLGLSDLDNTFIVARESDGSNGQKVRPTMAPSISLPHLILTPLHSGSQPARKTAPGHSRASSPENSSASKASPELAPGPLEPSPQRSGELTLEWKALVLTGTVALSTSNCLCLLTIRIAGSLPKTPYWLLASPATVTFPLALMLSSRMARARLGSLWRPTCSDRVFFDRR